MNLTVVNTLTPNYMKTFFILLLSSILLYGFMVHVWPKIGSFIMDIYLRCLSDEATENYFIKQYSKYKDNPKHYNDNYVKSYLPVLKCSVDYWNEMLEEAKKERFNAILADEIDELDKEIALYQQKCNFWNEALTRVSNDNAVRQYHASLKNG